MEFPPSPQQEAVLRWAESGSGSLNLVALAGTGKTSTLLMLADTIPEQETIFLGAFNKAIADELSDRLKKAGHDWQHARASTLHSAGFGAWRKVAKGVKVDGDKIKQILSDFTEDDDDDAELIKVTGPVIRKLVSFAKQGGFGILPGTSIDDPQGYRDAMEHHGLDGDLPEDVNPDEVINMAIDALKASIKLDYDIVDFDDMLYAPMYHKARFFQYDWVLIDEAQDTNTARRLVALALLKRGGRLVAVGDPKQAIYGFTGADSDSMNIIKKQLGSEELPLTVTYRCPKKVVAYANPLCPDLVAAPDNPDGVVRSVLLSGNEGQDFWSERLTAEDAILCRKTAPLIQLAFNLIRRGIGCRVEGRDIGEGLIALANRWETANTLDILLQRLVEYKEREMAKWIAKDKEAKAEQVSDKVETLVCLIDGQLQQDRKTRGDLIRAIKDMFGDTQPGEKPRVVTLSTVHKSKGREWKRVFILGRNEYMPLVFKSQQPWEREQEENLIYVAATRSMFELVEIVV